jgi:peptidyl-prolyl cis-trans isomerase B (cyclophilin B)
MGGPNFKYRDENLPLFTLENYPAGVVAMANSGPNTNGSQFFIVYEDTSMKSSYTIWGKVIKGLDIVKAIAKEGVTDGTTDGMPKQTIAIEKVRVR